MKPKFYVLLLLVAAIALTSCKKDIAYGGKYERSYRTWLNFKASSGNSYRYMVNSSSWTGYHTETIIAVEKGKVVGRSFVAKRVADHTTGQVDIYEEWSEETDSVGTHRRGFEPITLDEVYHRAKTDWLLKRNDAKSYFEADNNGMISYCGYVRDGCMDDCFNGIRISFIEKR